jgi:general secretion pathway protein G
MGPEKVTVMSMQISKRRSRGFTLIEMMVVLVVIGILAAAIIPQFLHTTKDAKISAAKGNVAALSASLQHFYVNMDRFPTTEEGLKALLEAPAGEESKWRGPYIEKLHDDPWGNAYQYRCPGLNHPTTFDVWSRGADGADGGENENADIGNW